MRRLFLCAVMLISGGQAVADAETADSTAGGSSSHDGLRWLKVTGELRGRTEFNVPVALSNELNAQYLHRARLKATITAKPWLRGVVELQDSEVIDPDVKPVPASTADLVDLRQAYLEMGSMDEGHWGVRIGRQPLVFGDRRLVSTSEWGNVGPGYDAIRLTWSGPRSRTNVFTSALVSPRRTQFDTPNWTRQLHGIYWTGEKWLGLPHAEAYVLWKSQHFVAGGRQPAMSIATYGTHLTGGLPRSLDYNIEMAGQGGLLSGEDMRAWAGHWELGRRLGTRERGTRFSAAYRFASGDSTPGDGRRHTFDSLYPTDKYGTADCVAWRNIHEAVAGADWNLNRKTTIKAAFRDLWLATTHDALYGLGGAVLALNPAAASSHAGREADVRWIFQPSRSLQLWVGYGHLFAGSYLTHSGVDGADFGFISWNYFLN